MRMVLAALVILPTLLGAALAEDFATSVNAETLKKSKRTKLSLYLTAAEAGPLIEADPSIVLLDTRSRAEFHFVGHAAPTDKNIPFRFIDPAYALEGKKYKMADNPDFRDEVSAYLSDVGVAKDHPIFVICRSGSRSAESINVLADLGYSKVYNITDGFEGDKDKETRHRSVNGWRNAGLPWSYDVTKANGYAPTR